MDADEIETMLRGIDWDEMFGFSNFAFKNIRRKADARAYPSHLEFGLKKGIVLPTSLNNGQQVDLLIGRITAPYYAAPTFDDAAHAVPRRGRRPAGPRRSSSSIAGSLADGDARHDVAAAASSRRSRWTATCWSTAAR